MAFIDSEPQKNTLLSAIARISIALLCALSTACAPDGRPAHEPPPNPPVKVAACTTWHYMLDALSHEGVVVVRTSSTRESLHLLDANIVDMVIAGRGLLPAEPHLDSAVLGPGYSLLAGRTATIAADELADHLFSTDMPAQTVIDRLDGVTAANLTEVDDVYEHLGRGVIITSLENTDYSRARMVHMLDPYGRRPRYSRTPILYWRQGTDERSIERVRTIVAEKEDTD